MDLSSPKRKSVGVHGTQLIRARPVGRNPRVKIVERMSANAVGTRHSPGLKVEIAEATWTLSNRRDRVGNMTEVQRIAVRAPNWIGDHVMAVPFYRGLREAYPEAELTLLGSAAVLGLPLPEVFAGVIPVSRGGSFRVRGHALRAFQFDLAITLPASLSSALLLWAARVPHRVGYARDGSDAFLTESLRWPGRDGGKHKSRLYLDLLEWLTGRSFLLTSFPKIGEKKEALFVIAPGASLPLREWPGFLDLIKQLRQHYPAHRVVVVGSSSDEKWHSQLRRLHDPMVEDWIGKTTLLELVALMKRARLIFANDSGPAHLAAYAGAPVLTVFGPGDPAYVKPLGQSVWVVRREDLPCSPCEKTQCRRPYGYQACLRSLEVESIMAKTASLLAPVLVRSSP